MSYDFYVPAVNKENVKRIKLRYYNERISKQKSIMKYIVEIMKLSDLQIRNRDSAYCSIQLPYVF